jgi:hypothetical protein
MVELLSVLILCVLDVSIVAFRELIKLYRRPAQPVHLTQHVCSSY